MQMILNEVHLQFVMRIDWCQDIRFFKKNLAQATTEQNELYIWWFKFLRLHIKACLYVSSMEVGVCAEAYQGREPLRHINSAFMTFEVLDSNWKPRTLPRLRPEPVVSLILCSDRLKTHFR